MQQKWWQKEIVYQIYPKSFYDSNGDGVGDIRGILEKLPYLRDLGVTLLWLCPVYRSPMADNGYDVADYNALAPEFGTMQDLEELIARAGEMGIRILMDLVINHTSDEHPWFQQALADPQSPCHDYYIFKTGKRPPNNWRSVFGGSVWEKVPGRDEYYFHSFGKKQPDLNWENPALRRELYKMVNGWLDKGIAGFRVDAINFIKKDQTWADREPDGADGLAKCTKACRNQPGLGAFLAELRRETFDRHDCVTVAETAGVPYDKLGAFIGEDGYFSMVFDFHYADLDIASGSEWFKRIPWTIPDLNEKIMRSQTALQQCGWAANFIENHDQPRATTKYLGAAQNDPDAVKTLGAMYFFLRGTPFIYQGQELGMVNFARTSPAQFDDISSIDQYDRAIQEGLTAEEALHIVNLRSRDNARTPFPWTAEQYGGFSQAKPWLAMTEEFPACNAAAQQKDSGSVLAFYRAMIRFRQEGPCSRTLIWGDITPVASSPDVIAYRRAYEGEEVWCWFNFGAAPAREAIPAGLEPVWGDTAAVQDGALVLPPHRFVLMRRTVR